ncbi:MAG: DUF4892 domain-containing protein [Oceanospirillaceae bacterium]|nr:DUF4892 domain-containing protein [Oceanospirillaceae bacterium]MCP5334855.1 DUF4892 domain-containing protein [Oceanospirillaceae bacterium]MCP5349526.1 DUF4892 domain-containing protein [Oceanospirillaceae bacterium]
MFRANLLILCCVLAAQVCAFEPYNGATLRSERQLQAADRWIVLGAVERIKGIVQAEKDVRSDADISSQLWQVPVGHNLDDVFAFYREQAEKAGLKTQFECKGRSCGSCNDIANQVFSQSLMVARDADQRYWIGARREGKQWHVWLVYAVQKVSKGTLVYTEKMLLKNTDAGLFDTAVKTQ